MSTSTMIYCLTMTSVIQPNEITLKIADLPIRLGQLLKFAGIADNGLEAKRKIQTGDILVNDQVELRRGRQIKAGDQILAEGVLYIIKVPE